MKVKFVLFEFEVRGWSGCNNEKLAWALSRRKCRIDHNITPKQGSEMTDGQTAKQNDGQTAKQNGGQTAESIRQNCLYTASNNYIKDTYNQKESHISPLDVGGKICGPQDLHR